MTIRMTPSAARLSAKGSFEPVGFSLIAQKPTSVSILSASATAIATASAGPKPPRPLGGQRVDVGGQCRGDRRRIGRPQVVRALRPVVIFDRVRDQGSLPAEGPGRLG